MISNHLLPIDASAHARTPTRTHPICREARLANPHQAWPCVDVLPSSGEKHRGVGGAATAPGCYPGNNSLYGGPIGCYVALNSGECCTRGLFAALKRGAEVGGER